MDFFESYYKSDKQELMDIMENFNARLVYIIRRLQSSEYIEDDKNELFKLIDDNIDKYMQLILPLNKILKTKDSILEELKNRIIDEIAKVDEIAKQNKWRRVVYSTVWIEKTRETWASNEDAGDRIVNSYYVGPKSRMGYSDRIEDHRLDEFNISQNKYNSKKREFDEISIQMQNYLHIIDNYREFKVYATGMIRDYENVIIFSNSDIIKCVKRRIVSGSDSFNPNPIEEDIIFVIFENENEYYGININGARKIVDISDYEVMIDAPKCSHFIISDLKKFTEKILDIKTDRKKKILFENQFTMVIAYECFMLYHNHADDEPSNWRDPCPACNGTYAADIIYSELQNYKFTEYMLNPISNKLKESTSYWDHFKVPIYPVYHAVWENFILRFNQSNNYTKKYILQQFKCLFTTNDEQEKMLYEKMEMLIQPQKLIDLFIPEIKFLLHRIYLPTTLETEWINYTSGHNKPIETPPQEFLDYLLTVPLSNLVSKHLYLSLLSSLDNMMKLLSKRLSTKITNKQKRRAIISKIIHRVVSNFVLKQDGGNSTNRNQSSGKLRSTKKSRRKHNSGKLSRKKLRRKT